MARGNVIRGWIAGAFERVLRWIDQRFTVSPWVAMPRQRRLRWCAFLLVESLALLALFAVLTGGTLEPSCTRVSSTASDILFSITRSRDDERTVA
jgi:hypothetical protein